MLTWPRQVEALARPETCAVKDQQERAEGRVLEWRVTVLQNRRRVEEALKLAKGIDVGLEGPRDAWPGSESGEALRCPRVTR